MRIKPWLALPAALAALAVAQPSAAAVVSYTYTGVVDFGDDSAGLFGAPGGSLTGLDFTAVFYRDDALALPENMFQGEVNSYVTGEGAYAPVWAKLTINGVTLDIGGISGEQDQYDDGQYEGFTHTAAGSLGELTFSGNTIGTFAPTLGDVLAGPDYRTLTSLPTVAGLGFDIGGGFHYTVPNDDENAPKVTTFANLYPSSLTVNGAPTAPVPEPAAWALMIMGLGGVGAMLRRRPAMHFA